MIRVLLLSTALGAAALPARAQDKGEACADWSVGFAYASCAREEGMQVYALPDGSVRRLTEDPAVAETVEDHAAAAQETVSRLRSYVEAGGASMAADAADAVNALEAEIGAGTGEEPGPIMAQAETAIDEVEAEPLPEASGEAGTTVRETVRTTVRGGVSTDGAAADGAGESGEGPAYPVQRLRSGQSLSYGAEPEGGGEGQSWESEGDLAVPEGGELPAAGLGTPAAAALPDLGQDLNLPTDLPAQVTSNPGQTVLLQMSLGHLNRIETPFSDPMVKTSQSETELFVDFDANFVYVSVTQPSTMFIHERGHPDPAIAVSLIPQKILPRQVKIDLPAEQMRKVEAQRPADPAPARTASASGATGGRKSASVSTKSPRDAAPRANSRGVRKGPEHRVPANDHNPSYDNAQLLKAFSGGQVPAGFVEGTLKGFTASAFCGGHSGATFSFSGGRMIYSNSLIIVRGQVTASRKVQLDERSCNRHRGTVAVAFSPKTLIGPENPTDFYIVLSRAEVEKRG